MIAQNTQPAVLSAGSITGDSVVNRKGENLGKIEELMVDTSSGQISYAVLSFGGFLGMGDKLFAMPWKALELDQVNERFILDVPKERLENAPGFDKDNWPSFADDRFKQSVNTYYSDYTRNRISGRLASPASRTVETAAPSRERFVSFTKVRAVPGALTSRGSLLPALARQLAEPKMLASLLAQRFSTSAPPQFAIRASTLQAKAATSLAWLVPQFVTFFTSCSSVGRGTRRPLEV